MKRLLLLIIKIWQQTLKLYFTAAFVGACIGIVVLAPSYDYIYAREQSSSPLSSMEYVFIQIKDLLSGRLSQDDVMLMLFYAEIGALLGLMTLGLYSYIHSRLAQIDYLKAEIDKDLPSIIRQGEGPYLEFKSSLRWDYAESRINRSLETVILKTLAGFLNSHIGGTLLIGVSDQGDVLGLDQDYHHLKKPNHDGFEQAVMTLISSGLGADVCPFTHILFHVIDNREVCRIIVSPSPRPVFVDMGNSPRFFTRTGGGTRELNIEEALSYVPRRWRQK